MATFRIRLFSTWIFLVSMQRCNVGTDTVYNLERHDGRHRYCSYGPTTVKARHIHRGVGQFRDLRISSLYCLCQNQNAHVQPLRPACVAVEPVEGVESNTIPRRTKSNHSECGVQDSYSSVLHQLLNVERSYPPSVVSNHTNSTTIVEQASSAPNLGLSRVVWRRINDRYSRQHVRRRRRHQPRRGKSSLTLCSACRI